MLHYGKNCSGIAESTYQRMGDKKSTWRCAQCRNSGSQSGIAEVLQEIKAFRAEFGTVRSEIAVLKTNMEACTLAVNDINTKWTAMESRFSNIEDRLIAVEKNSDLLSKLQSDLAVANATVSNLQNENDMREQYARMNNVEISGLPKKNGENLVSLVCAIFVAVGLDLDGSAIDSVHRVRRFVSGGGGGSNGRDGGAGHDKDSSSNLRPPAVIVKFTRRIHKDALLSAVRARRGLTTSSIGLEGPAQDLYLSDHLTPANKLLLKRARQLKTDNKISYLWIRDCQILARKTETSKVIYITKNFDFNKLK
ncbi:hypothetical protein NE865_10626 [Phthorimaea operculella]|nr:hypothetical protein NE865_10626 [Phthorimaea operculella]